MLIFVDLYEDMSPYLNPEALCVFCDGPMPVQPSHTLKGLMHAAKLQAQPDITRRWMNPYALKLSNARSADTCARHHFECLEMVKAREHGWPQVIDFVEVGHRIRAMKDALEDICEDVHCEGARKACTFWNEIISTVHHSGLAKAMGMNEQLKGYKFRSLQPG